jgi:hypothetical protein
MEWAEWCVALDAEICHFLHTVISFSQETEYEKEWEKSLSEFLFGHSVSTAWVLLLVVRYRSGWQACIIMNHVDILSYVLCVASEFVFPVVMRQFDNGAWD